MRQIHSNRSFHCRVAGLLISLTFGGTAAAQTASPSLPSPQQVTPPVPETRRAPRVEVNSRAAFAIEPCSLEESTLRLDLRGVTFAKPDGSPLPPYIAALVARIEVPSGDQPVRVLCRLRDEVNAALRREGWIASVQIPPQEITDGRLQLHVVTARLVETRVQGDPGPYAKLLRARLAQLQSQDPLNEKVVERLLLLTGDVPGLDIQLALRPGSVQGEVIGEATVNFRRFTILANAQNYNSRSLGRETTYVRGEYYGLTGLGDLTYVGGSATADFREQKLVQVGHIFGLDRVGSTFGGRLSHAWSRPDLGALDYRTETLITGLDFTRPLLRSVNANASVGAGFDYIDQTSNIHIAGSSIPLTRDRMRIAYASLNGDQRAVRMDGSVLWSLRTSLELRKGFDILNASRPGVSGGRTQSRIDGHADAFVARGNVEGLAAVAPGMRVLGRGQAQWTNVSLLNYEEFSVGNLSIGRGYDPGATSGDRAVALSGEIEFDVPVSAKLSSQVFGFYDFVYLDNLDRGATERNRSLSSFGGGVRLGLPGMALLEITYAHPKDKALTIDERRPSDRVLVSLSLRFSDSVR